MFISAANPAGLPQVSLCIVGLASESAPSCNGGGELHPYCRRHANSERALIVVACSSLCAHETFALESVCRVRARLRCFSCALRQLALLLRLRRPADYGFPPNLVRKEHRKDFSGASVNAELRHLGAWPTRLMVPRPRSGDSTNGDNHVPEQSNPHRLPR